MRARPLALFLAVAVTLAAACSQRVTPEEEYAKRERDRPLMSEAFLEEAGAPAAPGVVEGPSFPVVVEAPAGTDGGVLFVIVRPVGATSGPPLAVRRVPAPSFPLEVAIGPGDAMIPGTELPDRVTITARLDGDGDASTTSPADLAATGEAVAGDAATRLVLQPGAP